MAGAGWSDPEFLSALLRSPTFWNLFATWPALAAGACLAACAALVTRFGARLRRLPANCRGSASANDLVMVTPVFVVIITVMVQFAIVIQSHLINHYAAFSAARSARVHFCPTPEMLVRGGLDLGNVVGNYADRFMGNAVCTTDRNKAQEMAERAARLALVAASPSSPSLTCQKDCRSKAPEAAIRAMTDSTEFGFHTPALLRQAYYAFDPDNVSVKITVYQNMLEMLYRAWRAKDSDQIPQVPITATVTYRQHMLLFIGRILGDEQRSDGYYFIKLTAEMTLL